MSSPTRADAAGRAYLELRQKAREDRRPVDELLALYVLERYLARLGRSPYADQLVLKGGVLLAAFGERRPTKDVDLQAEALDNDPETVQRTVCQIAAVDIDDGVQFLTDSAHTVVIREEDAYNGVRVTMNVTLATARPHFHVDVGVGDPITPPPIQLRIPGLLGGEVKVRGYPLAMVHAEKLVTAIQRGTVNTRWRDFADIYLLSRAHPLDGTELLAAIHDVAEHRAAQLAPLAGVLDGYPEIGQQGWARWRRRAQLDARLPERFGAVLDAVSGFAEAALDGSAAGRVWEPARGGWT